LLLISSIDKPRRLKIAKFTWLLDNNFEIVEIGKDNIFIDRNPACIFVNSEQRSKKLICTDCTLIRGLAFLFFFFFLMQHERNLNASKMKGLFLFRNNLDTVGSPLRMPSGTASLPNSPSSGRDPF